MRSSKREVVGQLAGADDPRHLPLVGPLPRDAQEGELQGELRGIIPRTVEDIFTYIVNDPEPSSKYLVRASYLQVGRGGWESVGCDQGHD